MVIFLGIMAALFCIFTINEPAKDKRETYAFCFAVSVLGIVAYKLIVTLM